MNPQIRKYIYLNIKNIEEDCSLPLTGRGFPRTVAYIVTELPINPISSYVFAVTNKSAEK